MKPTDHELTFYLNSRDDAHLLDDCLESLRAHYPDVRVIIRSDGDENPAIGVTGRRHRAEVVYGEWLFCLERGGEIVDEMLRLFLLAPTRWLFKIDPDTRIHRRFDRLPATDCIFGTVQQQGGLFSIQGGCVGFTEGSARLLHDSGAARDPNLARVPPPWAFNAALRSRPVERGLTSIDWVVGWTARALGIPLLDWPEILSEWALTPEGSEGHAITHPHKPAPVVGAVSSSVRHWGPALLVHSAEDNVLAAPIGTPLEVDAQAELDSVADDPNAI